MERYESDNYSDQAVKRMIEMELSEGKGLTAYSFIASDVEELKAIIPLLKYRDYRYKTCYKYFMGDLMCIVDIFYKNKKGIHFKGVPIENLSFDELKMYHEAWERKNGD